MELEDQQEKKIGKELYAYQKAALNEIFDKLKNHPERYNLLYQLPTGGGKTVIFSEITRRYIKNTGKKVVILTHRIELCGQTSKMLDEFGVKNMIIDSKVKNLPMPNDYMCFVAMVETLNNRLSDEVISLDNVGLIIVDEAHHNSFRKIFKYFNEGVILGVTATPLSSNIKLPMRKDYEELIIGESIPSLIEMGFLANPMTYKYHVGLGALRVGTNGDYTVRSSELLYTNFKMQDKLLSAYEERSKGKKTLIFNNGINTSKFVYATFKQAGYEIKHLDYTSTPEERRETLEWFKNKPDAILTSVSILTTGFDEPTVDSIILNRATRSLTLYLQMIGRGSRILPNKSEFTIIDLGNNASRFGYWNTQYDWAGIFRSPEFHVNNLISDEEIEEQFIYEMPDDMKAKFGNSESTEMNIKRAYHEALKFGERPIVVIEKSIEQHVSMCVENSENLDDALDMIDLLSADINSRVKQYSYCLSKSSANYITYLEEEYKRKLNVRVMQSAALFEDAD